MSLELSRRKLQLKFEGRECECFFPTARQIADYQKDIKEDKADGVEVTIKFLVSLGLPQEVVDVLEIEDMTLIVEKFSEKKR